MAPAKRLTQQLCLSLSATKTGRFYLPWCEICSHHCEEEVWKAQESRSPGLFRYTTTRLPHHHDLPSASGETA